MFREIEGKYKKESPYNKFGRVLMIVAISIYIIAIISAGFLLKNIADAAVIAGILVFFITLISLLKSFGLSIIKIGKNKNKLPLSVIQEEKNIVKDYLLDKNIYNEKTVYYLHSHYEKLSKPKNNSKLFDIILSLMPILVKGNDYSEEIMTYVSFVLIVLLVYYMVKTILTIIRFIKGEDEMYASLQEIFGELYVECVSGHEIKYDVELINFRKIRLKFIVENYDDANRLIKRRKIRKTYAGNLMLDDIIEKVARKYERIPKNTRFHIFDYFLPDIYDQLWSEYFNHENGFTIDENWSTRGLRSSLHFPLKRFEKIFNISKKKIVIQINKKYGFGGGVGSFDGIRFYIHNANEKDKHANKPHVHCDYSGESISVDLNTLEVTGEFKNPKKQKIALEKIKKNRVGLLNYYQKVAIEGETIKFEMIG